MIALNVSWLSGRVSISVRVLDCTTVTVWAIDEGSCTVWLSIPPMVVRKVAVLVGMAISLVNVPVSVVEGKRRVVVVMGKKLVAEMVALLIMDVTRKLRTVAVEVTVVTVTGVSVVVKEKRKVLEVVSVTTLMERTVVVSVTVMSWVEVMVVKVLTEVVVVERAVPVRVTVSVKKLEMTVGERDGSVVQISSVVGVVADVVVSMVGVVVAAVVVVMGVVSVAGVVVTAVVAEVLLVSVANVLLVSVLVVACPCTVAAAINTRRVAMQRS